MVINECLNKITSHSILKKFSDLDEINGFWKYVLIFDINNRKTEQTNIIIEKLKYLYYILFKIVPEEYGN